MITRTAMVVAILLFILFGWGVIGQGLVGSADKLVSMTILGSGLFDESGNATTVGFAQSVAVFSASEGSRPEFVLVGNGDRGEVWLGNMEMGWDVHGAVELNKELPSAWSASSAAGGFGTMVLPLQDFTGDGIPEILVGAPNEGRGVLYFLALQRVSAIRLTLSSACRLSPEDGVQCTDDMVLEPGNMGPLHNAGGGAQLGFSGSWTPRDRGFPGTLMLGMPGEGITVGCTLDVETNGGLLSSVRIKESDFVAFGEAVRWVWPRSYNLSQVARYGFSSMDSGPRFGLAVASLPFSAPLDPWTTFSVAVSFESTIGGFPVLVLSLEKGSRRPIIRAYVSRGTMGVCRSLACASFGEGDVRMYCGSRGTGIGGIGVIRTLVQAGVNGTVPVGFTTTLQETLSMRGVHRDALNRLFWMGGSLGAYSYSGGPGADGERSVWLLSGAPDSGHFLAMQIGRRAAASSDNVTGVALLSRAPGSARFASSLAEVDSVRQDRFRMLVGAPGGTGMFGRVMMVEVDVARMMAGDDLVGERAALTGAAIGDGVEVLWELSTAGAEVWPGFAPSPWPRFAVEDSADAPDTEFGASVMDVRSGADWEVDEGDGERIAVVGHPRRDDAVGGVWLVPYSGVEVNVAEAVLWVPDCISATLTPLLFGTSIADVASLVDPLVVVPAGLNVLDPATLTPGDRVLPSGTEDDDGGQGNGGRGWVILAGGAPGAKDGRGAVVVSVVRTQASLVAANDAAVRSLVIPGPEQYKGFGRSMVVADDVLVVRSLSTSSSSSSTPSSLHILRLASDLSTYQLVNTIAQDVLQVGTASTPLPSWDFGGALTSPGDVDGDGAADLLLGVPQAPLSALKSVGGISDSNCLATNAKSTSPTPSLQSAAHSSGAYQLLSLGSSLSKLTAHRDSDRLVCSSGVANIGAALLSALMPEESATTTPRGTVSATLRTLVAAPSNGTSPSLLYLVDRRVARTPPQTIPPRSSIGPWSRIRTVTSSSAAGLGPGTIVGLSGMLGEPAPLGTKARVFVGRSYAPLRDPYLSFPMAEAMNADPSMLSVSATVDLRLGGRDHVASFCLAGWCHHVGRPDVSPWKRPETSSHFAPNLCPVSEAFSTSNLGRPRRVAEAAIGLYRSNAVRSAGCPPASLAGGNWSRASMTDIGQSSSSSTPEKTACGTVQHALSFEAPNVASIAPGLLASGSNSTLVLSGIGLPYSSGIRLRLFLGNATECFPVSSLATGGYSLSCAVGPGVGKNLPLSLYVEDDLVLDAGESLSLCANATGTVEAVLDPEDLVASFVAPVVDSVNPPVIFASPAGSNATQVLRVRVRGLPSDPRAFSVKVTVGQTLCTAPVAEMVEMGNWGSSVFDVRCTVSTAGLDLSGVVVVSVEPRPSYNLRQELEQVPLTNDDIVSVEGDTMTSCEAQLVSSLPSSALRILGAPRVDGLVSSNVLDPSESSVLELIGSGFGTQATGDVVRVWLDLPTGDTLECSSPVLNPSARSVRCSLPANQVLGAGLDVRVETKGGLVSAPGNGLVSFQAPTLFGPDIDHRDFFVSPIPTRSVTVDSLILHGTGFIGTPEKVLYRAWVGGHPCGQTVRISDVALQCLDLSLRLSRSVLEAGEISEQLVVAVDANGAAAVGSPVVEIHANASSVFIEPRTLSTTAPTTILLWGQGLISHTETVRVSLVHPDGATVECANPRIATASDGWVIRDADGSNDDFDDGDVMAISITENAVACDAPAGVGRLIRALLHSPYGAETMAGTMLMYRNPVVESVIPSVITPGRAVDSVRIAGRFFGMDRSLTTVTIDLDENSPGGPLLLECPILSVQDTEIICGPLPALPKLTESTRQVDGDADDAGVPSPSRESSDNDDVLEKTIGMSHVRLDVRVGNSIPASTTSSMFRAAGRPRISGIFPKMVLPGNTLEISGEDFGVQDGDLKRVYIQGAGIGDSDVSCPVIQHTSTRISCTMPWDLDNSRLPAPVVVETILGISVPVGDIDGTMVRYPPSGIISGAPTQPKVELRSAGGSTFTRVDWSWCGEFVPANFEVAVVSKMNLKHYFGEEKFNESVKLARSLILSGAGEKMFYSYEDASSETLTLSDVIRKRDVESVVDLMASPKFQYPSSVNLTAFADPSVWSDIFRLGKKAFWDGFVSVRSSNEQASNSSGYCSSFSGRVDGFVDSVVYFVAVRATHGAASSEWSAPSLPSFPTCPMNTYLTRTEPLIPLWECSECPPNFVCSGTVDNDPLNSGDWPRPARGFGIVNPDWLIVETCPIRDACQGGYTCREGYSGRLCSRCMDGYTRNGMSGKCVPCNRATSIIILVCFVVLPIVGYTILIKMTLARVEGARKKKASLGRSQSNTPSSADPSAQSNVNPLLAAGVSGQRRGSRSSSTNTSASPSRAPNNDQGAAGAGVAVDWTTMHSRGRRARTNRRVPSTIFGLNGAEQPPAVAVVAGQPSPARSSAKPPKASIISDNSRTVSETLEDNPNSHASDPKASKSKKPVEISHGLGYAKQMIYFIQEIRLVLAMMRLGGSEVANATFGYLASFFGIGSNSAASLMCLFFGSAASYPDEQGYGISVLRLEAVLPLIGVAIAILATSLVMKTMYWPIFVPRWVRFTVKRYFTNDRELSNLYREIAELPEPESNSARTIFSCCARPRTPPQETPSQQNTEGETDEDGSTNYVNVMHQEEPQTPTPSTKKEPSIKAIQIIKEDEKEMKRLSEEFWLRFSVSIVTIAITTVTPVVTSIVPLFPCLVLAPHTRASISVQAMEMDVVCDGKGMWWWRFVTVFFSSMLLSIVLLGILLITTSPKTFEEDQRFVNDPEYRNQGTANSTWLDTTKTTIMYWLACIRVYFGPRYFGRETWAFISSYKHSYEWWEAVLILRRISISIAMAVMLPFGATIQALSVSIIEGISLKLLSYSPYEYDPHTKSEQNLSILVIITCCCIIFADSQGPDQPASATLLYMSFSFNLAAIILHLLWSFELIGRWGVQRGMCTCCNRN